MWFQITSQNMIFPPFIVLNLWEQGIEKESRGSDGNYISFEISDFSSSGLHSLYVAPNKLHITCVTSYTWKACHLSGNSSTPTTVSHSVLSSAARHLTFTAVTRRHSSSATQTSVMQSDPVNEVSLRAPLQRRKRVTREGSHTISDGVSSLLAHNLCHARDICTLYSGPVVGCWAMLLLQQQTSTAVVRVRLLSEIMGFGIHTNIK